MTSHETIAIRRAADTDSSTVARLAALDSAPMPSGELLIAEVGGVAQGAIEIATGNTIADPFRPTAHVVELLSLRAARIAHGAAASRRPRFGRRLATAPRRTPGAPG